MREVIVSNLIETAIAIALSIAIYWVLSAVGRRWVKRMSRRGQDDAARALTLWLMVRRVLVIVIGVTLVLSVLSVWDVDLAPFVAVGSAVGVAVGFGAQGLVADIIAGWFILAEDQFSIGDWISVIEAGVQGEVREIRLRVTVLADVSGEIHYVPNGEIRVSTNHTQAGGQIIDVMVAHGSPLDTVFEVMSDELVALSHDPEWREVVHGVPTVLGVQSLEGVGITVRASFTASPDAKFDVRREALRRLTARLSREGIEVPVPLLGRQP